MTDKKILREGSVKGMLKGGRDTIKKGELKPGAVQQNEKPILKPPAGRPLKS
jgi:hypothetical protein